MKVADEFAEENDVKELLEQLAGLRESYSVQELPRSREEFENRAMLYHIMEDMRVFLEIKREFAESLSTSALAVSIPNKVT